MSILSFLKSKVKVGGELTSGSVTIAVFQDMRNRYNAYVKANQGKLPTKIYTVKGGSNYVLLVVFDDMVSRHDVYVKNNGHEPTIVYIKAVVPVINKPSWYLQLEKNLNMTINSMNDLDNGVRTMHNRIGSIYQHIPCMQGATIDDIVHGVTYKYNNCARWAYLGMQVAIVLGEKNIKYIHVDCDFSNHKSDPNAGHYLLIWNGIKYDLAEVADTGAKMGVTMCINGYNSVIDNKTPC
jgi:hypothetical protein